MQRKKGFTLIEILVTLGIFTVILVAIIFNYSGTSGTALKDTTRQVGTMVRQAQSDAMAQSHGAGWGVHFDNTTATKGYYSLFYTFNGTYGSSTEVSRYVLPAGICFDTSVIPQGSSSSIIFGTLTGLPTAAATVTLQLAASTCGSQAIASTTVTVNSLGVVSY